MSAFGIYLWLTLPSVAVVLFILAALGVFFIGLFCAMADADDWSSNGAGIKRWLRICSATVVITALVPSTETIALMYVLPKMTSPEIIENVSNESKELYSIAKKALIKMAESEEAK